MDRSRPWEQQEEDHEYQENSFSTNEEPTDAGTPLFIVVLRFDKVGYGTEDRYKYLQSRFIVECHKEVKVKALSYALEVAILFYFSAQIVFARMIFLM